MATTRTVPIRYIRLLGALLLVALCALLLWYALAASATSTQSRAADSALTYARQYMTWSSGPALQSTHTLPLRHLTSALTRYTPSRVARGVNVPDLLRRYGPNRQVALVVLYGVYNSLPPDEGVNVDGDVVLLVDARTNRVLFVTD